jgi:phosphomannomutase
MNPSIFRAYDIRGVYGKDFTDADFQAIGNAFSACAKHTMIVGRDCRVSSPNLKASLMKGLAMAGIDVFDNGLVPKGATLFWSFKNKIPALYVTASHLTPEWNGVKFYKPDGSSLSDKENRRVKEDALAGRLRKAGVPGMVEQAPVLNEFRKFMREKIPLVQRSLRVLLDCGNGTAGLSAPDAFADHGCEVSALYAQPDGRFPNRQSEIKEGVLSEAVKRAKDFDMTAAFDGDADRVALVDNRGRYMGPELAAYVMMRSLLKEQKGPVVANVECSRIVDKAAEGFGRKVVRVPVGYPFMMDAMNRSRACFGVEKGMHFVIPSIMPMDDGIVASLYAAYALSREECSLADVMDEAPQLFSQRRDIAFPTDSDKDKTMSEAKAELAKRSKKTSAMDGIRLEFDRGWVLVRPSNTSPVLRVTVEGESKSDLASLMEEYWDVVSEIAAKHNGKEEQ